VAHDGKVGQNPDEPTTRWGGEAEQSTPVWYRTQFSSRAKWELTEGWSPWGHGRATGTRRQLAGEEVEGAMFEVGRHRGTQAVVLEATGGQRRMKVGGLRACLKRWTADEHDSLRGSTWL
jgi:hypothetical protein